MPSKTKEGQGGMVKLSKQTKLIVRPEESITVSEITVQRIVYLPEHNLLRVFCAGVPHPWETTLAADSTTVAAFMDVADKIIKEQLA